MLPAGGWRLRARHTRKEGFRGVPIGKVIDEAVPRLSPPLLVDEAFRFHPRIPSQRQP